MNRTGRFLRSIVALSVAAAAVAGCGGDGGAADAPATSGDTGTEADDVGSDTAGDVEVRSDRDVWVGELEDGSQLHVRLRAGADEPAVAPFESFRQAADGADVVWIVGEVTVPADVSDGAGAGRFLTFVVGDSDPLTDDPTDANDGVTTAGFACSMLQDWLGATPSDDLLAAYTELYNGVCAGNTLAVVAASGATTSYILVHPAPLPEFDSLLAGLATPLTPG